jgi:hypothetical protein
MCVNWRGVSSRLLQPGTYYGIDILYPTLEPPWPPPTNDTCASPKTITVPGTVLEDRIVSGGNRYYTFTTDKTNLFMMAKYAGNFSTAAFNVYPAGCGDASPSLGGLALIYDTNGAPSTNFLTLPPGTYSLVASDMAIGTRYEISLQ